MKKKSFDTILYSTVGIAAMAALLMAVNFIAAGFKQRVDLTREKAYTLSAGTKAILRKLDTPVKIRFYCTRSENETPETVYYTSYAKRVEDLLGEYKQAAPSKVTIEKYDPQPDSDAEDSARLDGLEGHPLPDGERFYLGLSVSLGPDQRATIPSLDPARERLLEYDLSRAITQVQTPERPVIGILSAMPVFGAPANPMMMQMGQQGQDPWMLVTELKDDFTVKQVEMDTDKIDDDIRLLLVIHPREISDKAQYAIDQFIMRGGKLIAFLDPLPLIDSQKQNEMLGSIPNSGSSMDKLLKAWGITFDTTKVVADLNDEMTLGGRNGEPQKAPAFLKIPPSGINSNDVVTSEISELWLPFAGAFTGTPMTGLKETVLIKSTKDSQLVDGFMANMAGESILKDFKPSGTEYALAIRLTGKFKTAFPLGKPEEKKDDKDADKKADAKPAPPKPEDSLKESKEDTSVILVGDADMIYDHFAFRVVQKLFGNVPEAMNGNLNFAQNAVEQLTGDNDLIAVRSRATQSHPFTVINNMETEAENRFRSRIKELQDSQEETERQLSELQNKKEKGQRFILSPEQQTALENFQKKDAEIKIQLKNERKQLRREIDTLVNRVTLLNIAGMPVVVCVSGLGLAFFKRKRTAAK